MFTAKHTLTLAASGLVVLGAGCKDQSIQVYQIPKEQLKPIRQMAETPARPPATAPHLRWGDLPTNWKAKAPSNMRAASIEITGKDGLIADVGAIPLPRMAGKELEFVNMWRGGMNLPQTTTNAIAELREDVTIAGTPGALFEMVSEDLLVEKKYKQRVVVGMLTEQDSTWFFKLTGPDELVAAEKQNFVNWLETVEIDTSSHGPETPQMSQTPAPASTTSPGDWKIPSTWTAQPPRQMLLASFALPGGDAKVEVSSLGGDGGGLLANINRWRGQLGLPQASESQLSEITSPLDTVDGKGTLVDIQGNNQKLLVVIVPHNGKSWFYKSMGATDVVDRERDAFLEFAQTAKR